MTPVRVAILGAGPAGLAAAWGLTQKSPDDGSAPNVEVTVYEQDWRAGGKCASSRLPRAKEIVQNGTHYLFGVYFNTLGTLQKAQAEISDPRFGGLHELVPRNLIAFKHFYDGQWTNWKFDLPELRLPDFGTVRFDSPHRYLRDVLRFLRGLCVSLKASNPLLGPILDLLIGLLDLLIPSVDALVTGSDPPNPLVVAAVRLAAVTVRGGANTLMKSSTDIEIVRMRILVNFMLTMIVGIIDDDVLYGGIGKVDDYDFAEWLRHHYAEPETVTSPLVCSWYDSVAAYENGDPSRPSFSAAAALQSLVPAVIAYRGSFCYQMKAEVGEGLIAPIYQALRVRGVKFRFLHELRNIQPNSSGDRIESLEFAVPSLPGASPGAAETALEAYDPLDYFTTNAGQVRAYWPPGPKAPFDFLGQIEMTKPHLKRAFGPARDSVTRTLPGDFDHVIFALPHSVIAKVAPKLVSQKPRWQKLSSALPAVETKSLRLWLAPPFVNLNWDPDVPARCPVLSAYKPLFSTWEDSGQQLELHKWTISPPKSIATVFGPLRAHRFPFRCQFFDWLYSLRQLGKARKQAEEFLVHHAAGLWPGLVDASGNFRWDLLVPAGTGPADLAAHWVVANTGASARYTHAAPGTFKHRLRSKDTDYSNLSVAGEWTRFWPATASVELSVMSGLRAAWDFHGYAAKIPSEGGFFPA